MQQIYEKQLNKLAGIVRGTTKKLKGILVKNPDYNECLRKLQVKKWSKIVMDLLTALPFISWENDHNKRRGRWFIIR